MLPLSYFPPTYLFTVESKVRRYCYLILFSSSVETLLPSPDSAFQLGDFFPMVKVPEFWKSLIIKDKNRFDKNDSSMMWSCLLWPGSWVSLCGDQTKSVGVVGEEKWRGGGGAGREKPLLEGLAHWSRDCRGFPFILKTKIYLIIEIVIIPFP